jgi:UDP-glucose 4-epimerase
MKILITGAAGFIGSHLADRLLSEGHELVGIDDLSTGSITNLPSGIHFVHGDITEIESLGDIYDHPWDLIYHCAASYKDRNAWERDARTNVLGTIAVVREALRTNARLVYFQTSLCYGLSPRSPVPLGAPLAPRGSYAVSKTAGETYIRDSGVDYVSLRLANIYGPRNLSGPIPTFYRNLTEGRPCTIVDARRDYVYVDDLVDVAVSAIHAGSGVFHVASGGDIPIRAIYAEVANAMGLNVPVPDLTPRGPDDAETILLEPSFRCETPLSVGIKAAVAWYDTHGVTETFTHLAVR